MNLPTPEIYRAALLHLKEYIDINKYALIYRGEAYESPKPIRYVYVIGENLQCGSGGVRPNMFPYCTLGTKGIHYFEMLPKSELSVDDQMILMHTYLRCTQVLRLSHMHFYDNDMKIRPIYHGQVPSGYNSESVREALKNCPNGIVVLHNNNSLTHAVISIRIEEILDIPANSDTIATMKENSTVIIKESAPIAPQNHTPNTRYTIEKVESNYATLRGFEYFQIHTDLLEEVATFQVNDVLYGGNGDSLSVITSVHGNYISLFGLNHGLHERLSITDLERTVKVGNTKFRVGDFILDREERNSQLFILQHVKAFVFTNETLQMEVYEPYRNKSRIIPIPDFDKKLNLSCRRHWLTGAETTYLLAHFMTDDQKQKYGTITP